MPVAFAYLATSFTTIYNCGKNFKWSVVQVLQVHRSLQCGLLAGVGLFSMGVMYGTDQPLSGSCSDDMFIGAIIQFFFCYFVTDLCIMGSIGHLRMDLLLHHGVALTGILSLIFSSLYPCASAPVAATELISVFSGIEAMLPKPDQRTPGETHVHYVCRTYRLAVLVILRPFFWQHVRLSAKEGMSATEAATYIIPGTVLPLLDVLWSYKIAKGLFPGPFKWVSGFLSANASKGHVTKDGNVASERKPNKQA